MTDRPTYCAECTHIYRPPGVRSPYYWLCIKHPRLEGMGFVIEGTWTNAEPYLRCRDVNGGACVLFAPANNPFIPPTEEPQAA